MTENELFGVFPEWARAIMSEALQPHLPLETWSIHAYMENDLKEGDPYNCKVSVRGGQLSIWLGREGSVPFANPYAQDTPGGWRRRAHTKATAWRKR